jgi:hypothetical protein
MACTSAKVCTACLSGYSLTNGNCKSNLDFPCAVTGANYTCTQCFVGYTLKGTLNGTICVNDLSCNNQTNCLACPYRYYLIDSKCIICPDIPKNCLTCDSVLGYCSLCKNGFYASDYSCLPCASNCISCTSATSCN